MFDIYPGTESSTPYDLTDVNGTLFFGAYEYVHAQELWSYSPTQVSVCQSTQSGEWHNIATWSCGHVPSLKDEVIINNGHTVTVASTSAQARRVSYRGGNIRFTLSPASLFLEEK